MISSQVHHQEIWVILVPFWSKKRMLTDIVISMCRCLQEQMETGRSNCCCLHIPSWKMLGLSASLMATPIATNALHPIAEPSAQRVYHTAKPIRAMFAGILVKMEDGSKGCTPESTETTASSRQWDSGWVFPQVHPETLAFPTTAPDLAKQKTLWEYVIAIVNNFTFDNIDGPIKINPGPELAERH